MFDRLKRRLSTATLHMRIFYWIYQIQGGLIPPR